MQQRRNICNKDGMECNVMTRGKKPIANKLPNSYPFVFLHLEIEKPPLYVGDH
jgi:hypothetical protein